VAIKFGGIELATRGDLIAAGTGYVVGFAVDSFFFIGGESSASTASACAVGALSLKYAVETLVDRIKKRADIEDSTGEVTDTEAAPDVPPANDPTNPARAGPTRRGRKIKIRGQ
jgi:hypothetical protein